MKFGRLIMLILSLLAAAVPFARAQMFLRLDGITGSSADPAHSGWMDINSLQWGAQHGTNIGGSSGFNYSAPAVSDFTVTKMPDAGSPQLANQMDGPSIGTGTIDIVKFDFTRYESLRANLTNIYLTGYSFSATSDGYFESVSFSPIAYSWNYSSYDTVTGLNSFLFTTWNIGGNAGQYGMDTPEFVSSGIRSSNGVQLTWSAIPGRTYRIYAVADLNKPFRPIAQIIAASSGSTNYTFTPTTPAMFFTVEQVPDGY